MRARVGIIICGRLSGDFSAKHRPSIMIPTLGGGSSGTVGGSADRCATKLWGAFKVHKKFSRNFRGLSQRWSGPIGESLSCRC